MRGTIAGLAAILALAIIVSPTGADSGVVTLNGGQDEPVATMTLTAGEVVEWAYSSGGSTKFTIDREGAGEVFSTSSMVGTGKFTAPLNGQYTFAFKNTADMLTIVSYDIKRPFNWTPVLVAGGVGAAALGGIGGFLWYRKRQTTGARGVMQGEIPPPPPPS